jgi:hypothetical protein
MLSEERRQDPSSQTTLCWEDRTAIGHPKAFIECWIKNDRFSAWTEMRQHQQKTALILPTIAFISYARTQVSLLESTCQPSGMHGFAREAIFYWVLVHEFAYVHYEKKFVH